MLLRLRLSSRVPSIQCLLTCRAAFANCLCNELKYGEGPEQ
jgi:hypothetical protein